MKKIFNVFLILLALGITGCHNIYNEENADIKYGTLIYNNASKALDVSSIKSVIVKVIGNGIDTPITQTVSNITGGTGSFVIEKVPVGKNRIVSVTGYSDTNAQNVIADCKISAVVDINVGVNNLEKITWQTSKKGYIYEKLYYSGVNLLSLTNQNVADIDNSTPDCDAWNIDLEKFATDFKANSLKEKSNYIKQSNLLEGKVIIFVKADSAPLIWVWEVDGVKLSEIQGYTWNTQPTMVEAIGMNDNSGWYMYDVTEVATGKPLAFITNKNSGDIASGKTATFWYDGTNFYDSDPTTPPEPVKPQITIEPANGATVAINKNITVSITDGNDNVSGTVVINGTSESFVGATTITKKISDLGVNVGDAVTVSVTATNSIGTTTQSVTFTTKEATSYDPFAWENALVYFVLTDRFYNGDTKNDTSYYRQKATGSVPDVATFHGGDIVGLTQKLDYLNDLGVNAIWITAPYEQAHGWVGGKDKAFPHYAFHGYYTLDWTYMDQNVGTIEEFRTFVDEAHKRGIRVVMDIVMNHVGYNNTEDMVEYGYGKITSESQNKHGWFETTNGKWDANAYVDFKDSSWDSTWFGPWIRSFGYASGTEYGGSCGGLPDVKTELTNSVGLPPILVNKWAKETDDKPIISTNTTGNKFGDYKLPSVSNVDWNGKTGDWRTDQGVAPADYQVMWLSAWVREFGIDGFRCDTAKHVEPFRWGQLKDACTAALKAWREDPTKKDSAGAKDWDENFWMTGECFGWTSLTASGGDYMGTGKFDSMINFGFNGSSGNTGRCPTQSDWGSYLAINGGKDDDGNGINNSVLSYVSSHDTGLHRSELNNLGTMLVLLPGGVQIYYGDESARPEINGYGDADMKTRGDMNWTTPTHWNKVGTFRKFNPAVGAGTGSATKRTFTEKDGTVSKVAIGISGASVDVSGLFSDGTTVYNWYDGSSAQVTGGTVSFSGGSTNQPILVSDRNPSDYGVTF